MVSFRSGGPTNHEHADRNTILVKANGERLLTEHFGASYNPNQEHWLLRLPVAHNAVLVNGQGQRFINEDAYLGRLGEYALLRNEGHAFLILDDATFARPDVPREIVAVGDSPAQLERELELPSGSLESTLRLYNEGAGRGEDPVFHKAAEWLTPLATPPFAALDCRAASSIYAAFTLGGLCTSVDAAVLSEAGEPIPGLFAAGRSTALFTAPGYSSGLSIGDGTFFGRRAGRAAAAR